ncbi:LacI family DNA-binding transcriptional regulator [Cellulomonas sp. HZM]|uniref:LacI family DNA-binding transcriptional regulator n=1 Tax=Cellulomonas sp. HZM TaxID=1454010 RepID=UPI000A65DEB4|nr:LacI family DNA-binding transcriptional regulator [Cellulomonas sp. HZM]
MTFSTLTPAADCGPTSEDAAVTTTQRVTISQIADLAGVSVPTVSKVLNGREGVSGETRDRVRELLEEHGYRRRGGERRKPVGLVDLVIRDLDSMWANELVRGAEAEAARAGVGLVVTATHGRRVGNKHWISHLAARRTDGVVLVVSELQPGAAEELRRLGAPYVLVDPVGASDRNVPTVAATNWAGGLSATEHLLALGHRRIGIITGPADLACARDRLDGYRSALQRAGIPLDEELVRYGDFLQGGGEAGAAHLLALPEPPTAIFAGSDQQAAGVYDVARARGLRVPEDLSVVGFDDTEVCEWVWPRLTTVRQPLFEMAATATRMLLQRRPDEDAGRVELSTSLIERSSTAPPSS